jgi:hypothetical protein
MRERYSICKLNNISHFWLRDDDARRFIKWQFDREVEIRYIGNTDRKEFFFDWNTPGHYPAIKGGFHSMVSEAYKAANDLRVGIDYDEDIDKIHIWTSQVGSERDCKKGKWLTLSGKLLKRDITRLYVNKKAEDINL